ncbi:TPA: hypothetical protein DEO28_02470 [Candidatus Dependentiae bacterium]|nr:MAG: BioY protein [candidate division TM6 bacterium GW2011_GWE2_31_21]KKP53258.1 MAG: BioY protein [candidate division TM6 bacterium GW2011_GWF2_33_332]HBS48043.1 hypothetical protein [Candidatus Dependentiae bacterium]HBZ73354.1 hypothetical protein [Candidatus Dependentiae bacterium]
MIKSFCSKYFQKNLAHAFSKISLNQIALTIALSWIYAISSQFIIPIGMVPFTLQVFTCALLPLVFGYYAFSAYILYLLQGVLGLPFFYHANSGLLHLLGPTGGFLIGWFFSIFFIVVNKNWGQKSFILAFFKLFLAQILLFSFGLLHLSMYVKGNNLLNIGLYPFLVGDFIKIIVAAFIGSRINRLKN